jgi:hypothetical protein
MQPGSPTSVTVDPVLDRLARIRAICGGVSAPSFAAARAGEGAPVDLPAKVLDAIAALIGSDISHGSKEYKFEQKFEDMRNCIADCPDEAELESVFVIMEAVHSLQLLRGPHVLALAGVAEGVFNLLLRNKSSLASTSAEDEDRDSAIRSLKNKVAAAEAGADEARREKSNLLDEFTSLGVLHQQVKTNALDVEGKLNMRIGSLEQDLRAVRVDNDSLLAAKIQLTQDAAELCGLLESREGEEGAADKLKAESSKKNLEELVSLRTEISQLSADKAELQTKYDTEKVAFAAVLAEAETHKKTSAAATDQATEAGKEARKLANDLKLLRIDLSAVQEEKDTFMGDYAALAASTQHANAEAAGREHSLGGKIKALEADLASLRQSSEAEADLATQLAAMQTMSEELAQSKASAASLQEQLLDNESELCEAQLKVHVLKETMESNDLQAQNSISAFSRQLEEAKAGGAAAAQEAEQNAMELSKTVQSLQGRLRELTVSAGANSVALREAYSSLDQTADLPEVAAWLAKQMQEHPAEDGDESGGERGALRTKILEINTANEGAMKSLRSEVKRLSKLQVSLERSLLEARELQKEYSGICDILQSEKKQTNLLLVQQSSSLEQALSKAAANGMNESSDSMDLLASPARSLAPKGQGQGQDDHNLSFSDPIIYVEIGNYECRVGLWDREAGCFAEKFSCPAIVARPKNSGALPGDLVKGASHQSGAMFKLFRETGFFVGDDAQFCAFDHPDPALRGGLEISHPLGGDGTILDAAAFGALFKYCVSKLLGRMNDSVDTSRFQTVFPFKSTFGETDKMVIGTLLFEGDFLIMDPTTADASSSSSCDRVYVIPEPFLTALSMGRPSAVVVDIGARSTAAIPVYEGVAINKSLRLADIGGEHCTDALEKLMDAKGLSAFSSCLPRRRKQIAREFKEKYAFVPKSFQDAVALYGAVSVQAVRVMHESSSELPEALGRILSNGDAPSATPADCSAIAVSESIKQPDGSSEEVVLDRELFYCTEVLFGGGKGRASGGDDGGHSIIAAILAAVGSLEDADMRAEICEHIVVTGGSAALPGLLERLQSSSELREGLAAVGVKLFNMHLAGSAYAAAGDKSPSSVFRGAQLRLAALQSGEERMDGGCVSAADYDNTGVACLDNLA